ncbi:MAG: short-chain dehydrogenase [Sphingobacteriales bacterium BACL12 MAG-120813-bin55]|jgi:3-oxoacyl-[acyl-carrier protein] reductase|nr:MAG: short-chain dehydrogenase [Sphingobacteriales bacterium BACL12 MAG-120813-bin55]
MELSLTNYNALVCGSTQGIGKAAAMELAGMGATVVLLARNKEKLEAVVQELPANEGQQHQFIVADFTQPELVRVAVEQFLKAFAQPIHILVNNTGGPAAGPVKDATVAAFMAAFDAHLINNHILASLVLPGMQESGYGRIINVISTSVKAPLPNLGVSNTIRGAVANWAKTLATEVGRYQITVNNVLPGATSTERLSSIIANKAKKSQQDEAAAAADMQAEIPLRRFAAPEEVANAIAFLASPAAAYINGINLPVDGGRTPSL